jgi:hypothetical protein
MSARRSVPSPSVRIEEIGQSTSVRTPSFNTSRS